MTQNSALLLTKPTHPAPVTAGRPLIGNMLDLRRDRLGFIQRLAAEGPVVRFRLANFDIYHVSRPKAVPLILQEIAPGSHA